MNYSLELQTIDLEDGTPICWLWHWWQGEDKQPANLIKTGDTARLSILAAYQDAVLWACHNAPNELCFAVCAGAVQHNLKG